MTAQESDRPHPVLGNLFELFHAPRQPAASFAITRSIENGAARNFSPHGEQGERPDGDAA
jgi:hypothetical protein